MIEKSVNEHTIFFLIKKVSFALNPETVKTLIVQIQTEQKQKKLTSHFIL